VLRPFRGYRLVVDWHEIWTREYWHEYLGRLNGEVGWRVQQLCVRIPHRAFCFSRLHERRLQEEGFQGELTVLRGEYAGGPGSLVAAREPPTVVFAGRHIPEKRVPALVPAIAQARESIADLRGEILGDGPDRDEVLRRVRRHALQDAIDVPGFVPVEGVEQALASALCLVLPSRREGYGLVVVEAAASGTPSVVVADPDNAATELIEDGVNGYVARSACPRDLAEAVTMVCEEGARLRESTFSWFTRQRDELSLSNSLQTVVSTYVEAAVT
jgi:glycosyltransferase involved in cell wall biosynthesis